MSIRSLLLQGADPGIAFMAEPTPAELAVQLVAFANTAGGTVILGMDTDGRVYYDSAESIEPVFLRALDLCKPSFQAHDLPEWRTKDIPDGQVVVVRVPYGAL